MSKQSKSESQNNAILAHLRAGGTITAAEAFTKFGCMRLAARIHDIKSRRYHVSDRWVIRDNVRYKEYFMPVAKNSLWTRLTCVGQLVSPRLNFCKKQSNTLEA